ncbi:MAG: NAD(P)H-dependent oxidoreductase [Cytophagales bacterium]|nr:NAD(P)H-dependent oxidoreductase [Cytophagales bacterium]
MKKILAIGASNSRQSINGRFARWAAQRIENTAVELLDLNDFEMPIYSIDRENETGIPQLAHDFKTKIKTADGIVISLAEHNGSYSAGFKNITDWVSRIEKGTWADKPVLLLATSPGQRGGAGVLASANLTFPYQGAHVVGTFSLPSFHQNFEEIHGIKASALAEAFYEQLNHFVTAI